MPEGLRGTEGSRPRVTARWMMACFCSLSSAITFRFARIARSSRPFAQSRNRTIAACSVGGGHGDSICLKSPQYSRLRSFTMPREQLSDFATCMCRVRNNATKNWGSTCRIWLCHDVGWTHQTIDRRYCPQRPATSASCCRPRLPAQRACTCLMSDMTCLRDEFSKSRTRTPVLSETSRIGRSPYPISIFC